MDHEEVAVAGHGGGEYGLEEESGFRGNTTGMYGGEFGDQEDRDREGGDGDCTLGGRNAGVQRGNSGGRSRRVPSRPEWVSDVNVDFTAEENNDKVSSCTLSCAVGLRIASPLLWGLIVLTLP